MSKRVAVTGGAGKLGRACVEHLLAQGYEVRVIDRVRPAQPKCPCIVADLSDYGQTIDAISGGDARSHGIHAVVHLAAIPAPRLQPDAETFRNNTLGDYHVFEACRQLGINDIVHASSETVLGLPFDTPPASVPIDETCEPRPESAYSLSKLLGETMAVQYCRQNPAMKIIGLRFSNVMEVADYAKFASFQDDARKRKWNLWGYIDARDASEAIRLSIEHQPRGAEVFIIANADGVMERGNEELLDEVFPGVPRARGFGAHETLLSIEKAKRVLGYAPRYSWRVAAGEPVR